jgi:hypothetical protein
VSLPPEPVGEESLRDLLMRVIDNTKAYVRAEINLVKTTVSTKAGKAGPALGLLVVALLVIQASLTVLVVALGALLACWIGWPAGLGLAAVIGFAMSGILAWTAYKKLMGVFR